ncbi:TPA: BRO family protein [Streptococcus agalactiae]
MRTETWNGYDIRFVEHQGEWWAVLADICHALDLKPKRVKERLVDEVVSTDHVADSLGRQQEMLIVNEFGYSKMVKKSEMTPDMLVAREMILDDTVELMGIKEKFGLNISVSESIYNKN